jgi:catechol 2,3-dioxygenase-like lactoylglutathione lyase family enzyme
VTATISLPIVEPKTAVAGSRFHISLNVKNLDRSVEFLRIFLDREPAKCRPDYAKFEMEDPPLVLSLEPHDAPAGGNLNHLGFRLPNSQALVDVQRRLELAGISTQREEGVECCYARQTKFWVHDPDGNLWEIYTLDEDIEHRGAGQVPAAVVPQSDFSTTGAPPAVWNHRIGESFAKRLPILDATVDQVMLQGTLNEPLSRDEVLRRLAEVHRVLKPGGSVHLHLLTANREVAGDKLALPAPASVVQHVPVDADVIEMLAAAGFMGAQYSYRADNPCFRVGEAELRETRLEAVRP